MAPHLRWFFRGIPQASSTFASLSVTYAVQLTQAVYVTYKEASIIYGTGVDVWATGHNRPRSSLLPHVFTLPSPSTIFKMHPGSHIL
jgi:hypothetical protein